MEFLCLLVVFDVAVCGPLGASFSADKGRNVAEGLLLGGLFGPLGVLVAALLPATTPPAPPPVPPPPRSSTTR